MARLTLRIMRYPTDYEGSGNAEIVIYRYDRSSNRIIETVWSGPVHGSISLELPAITRPPDYAQTYVIQGRSLDLDSTDFVGQDIYEETGDYSCALYFYGQHRDIIEEIKPPKKKEEISIPPKIPEQPYDIHVPPPPQEIVIPPEERVEAPPPPPPTEVKCFILTALGETELVRRGRAWRDSRGVWIKPLIKIYYAFSPTIAKCLLRSPKMRKLFSFFLPIILRRILE